ncbi:sensor histidine kinase [Actinomadura namibiensis]|uniref:histidine kinase n=1 Tax=Actinomadura namibiensis TaxID=182080 RepID=A0A7W3LQ06_ACTNM|nr:ATP-binding protein [Actinomadura namibiensis]MBA8952117.1 signal transduction histidine kinase [Actinomadura namibiensis]
MTRPTVNRLSVRTRLTLVYGSLFLGTAGVLVGVTYLLTRRTLDRHFAPKAVRISAREIGPLPPTPEQLAVLREQAEQQIAEQKAQALQQILHSSLAVMVVLCLSALLIGYLVAGRLLRPLHTVTATARRLSESTLHERIALDGPQDEIKDLADTFDRMLDRLHRAFDAQRRFVANASHELRTPLTINRTVLEVALASSRNPPETKALADVLLGNTARHERLIEGLLLLARSEREPRDVTDTALPDVARSALDQVEHLAGGVEVSTRLGEATVFGDPVLLERCAVNLLENALKYNLPEDGRVWLSTGRESGAAVLRVANTGRPVPAYEIGAIFEPFRRLRGDRVRSAEGAGLGLSIVRAVAHAHGGTVEAVPRDGGGLEVTVRLPAR